MDRKEAYRCEDCGVKHWSDVGSPLLTTEDERELCHRCYELRELECGDCGELFHHSELTFDREANDRYCKECNLEHIKSISDEA